VLPISGIQLMTAARRLRRARCLVRGAALAVWLVPVVLGGALAGERLPMPVALDRVAYAIDGAESSHGRNLAMWRPDPAGPQGPMQVCKKAAIDVGGGDRFDLAENRAIGRAYLAQLYRRYGNWADAIAAYNWGIGNLDSWIKTGRSDERLLTGVVAYLRRVLRDSGLCAGRDCEARLLGAGEPEWRAALATRRGIGGGGAGSPGVYRILAQAEQLAKNFATQQAGFDAER
jgi:transglycosylase-like protein with SLT domain